MSPLEFFAVIFGILYLGLISFHKRIGWIFGCVSSIIYVFVCAQQDLFIQSGLQLIYVILGVFGFLNWNKNDQTPIQRVSLKNHFFIILSGLTLSFFIGFVMAITDQKSPYLDAFVSIFSIVATILATKSILENWVYWIVANLFSIVLFWSQDLDITTFLYFIYLLGSIFGFYNWKKMEREQTNKLSER